MLMGWSFDYCRMKEQEINWIIFMTVRVIKVCLPDASVSSAGVSQLVIIVSSYILPKFPFFLS